MDNCEGCVGCFLSQKNCQIKKHNYFCPCKECLLKITCTGLPNICEAYRASLDNARDSYLEAYLNHDINKIDVFVRRGK